MTRLGRSLLVSEVALCFAWVAAGLLLSTFMVVVELLVALVRLDFPTNRDYWFIALLIGGNIGMLGVLNVVRWLLFERAFLRPRAGALALLAGVSTAVALMIDGGAVNRLSAIFVLPVAAAAHLAYLARTYFLGRAQSAPPAAARGQDLTSQTHPRKRERLTWKTAAGAIFLACAITDLFPLFGPPAFRYPGADPGNPVWNLGWPIPLFIYDPSNGIHVGPFTGIILSAQLVSMAIVLIVCLRPPRHGVEAVAR